MQEKNEETKLQVKVPTELWRDARVRALKRGMSAKGYVAWLLRQDAPKKRS
jgi:hypothetical protein